MLGGDYRGLGIAQSLGRQGIPVWVLREPSGHRIATMSRYVQRSLIWPGSHDDDNVAFLLDLNHTHGLQDWLLFPTGDEMTAFVGMHHAQLSSRYCLTTPPWEVFRWAYDKRLTYRLASEIGVPTPLTVYPFTSETPYSGPYPAIVKPGVKLGLDRLSIEKAWRVEDSAELAERFEEAATLHDPATLIVQELIPGDGSNQFSFAALCTGGEPIVSLVALRRRQYPMDFGRSSTFVETIDNPIVEALAMRIIRRLRLSGLVEVEFKRDPRDGEYKLLDVNARIWGWHTIGRRVGADFPLLQWQLATGQDVGACRAPARLRWLRLSTDVAASVPAILGGELSVRSYLGTLVGRHERALFAADDMLPGMLDIPLAALQEAAVRMHRPDRQPISSHILARLRVQSPVQEAQIPAPATPPDTGMSRPAPR